MYLRPKDRAKTPAKMRGYTSFRGIDLHHGSLSFDCYLLILFSSHSETVTCKNGEIVRLLRSETLHFTRCSGLNSEVRKWKIGSCAHLLAIRRLANDFSQFDRSICLLVGEFLSRPAGLLQRFFHFQLGRLWERR
jgi:hypothetical protein